MIVCNLIDSQLSRGPVLFILSDTIFIENISRITIIQCGKLKRKRVVFISQADFVGTCYKSVQNGFSTGFTFSGHCFSSQIKIG